MTDSLFQCYTQSILTASLKRREINLPVVTKQIPSNLKNLFMVYKEILSDLNICFFQLSKLRFKLDTYFMWHNAEHEVHKIV